MRKESSPDNGKHTLAEFIVRVFLIYPVFASASFVAMPGTLSVFALLFEYDPSTPWVYPIEHMMITLLAGLVLAPLLAATPYRIQHIFYGSIVAIFVSVTCFFVVMAFRGDVI